MDSFRFRAVAASRCSLLLVAIMCGVLPVYAVDQADCALTKTPAKPTNGIGVGCPKVFDNRTLTLMLESLSENLKSVQFIDQKTLAGTLGTLQGSQSRDVTSNLSITTTPTPATNSQTVLSTGNVDKDGNSLPNTTQTTNTKTISSITPQVPGLDPAQTTSGYTPNYGEGPSDLLSDQANLTYQIFNLRMLLERSLSDRLLNGQTRLQAVVGVNVSIDTPRTANDSVAVVEITVHTRDSVGGPTNGGPSLVSLMPEENAYNAAALSTKSNAFGGSAVVKMIQVGYSQRRSGKTFYLYRDIDMMAYQRMLPEDPTAIVFGWIFRPVLGRRSISVVKRQLFAVVALPHPDAEPAGLQGDPAQYLDAKVRTYWKKYDPGTMTSFEPRDTNRAKRAKYSFSLSLARPEIFGIRYENGAEYTDIPVYATKTYERGLRPSITDVTWQPTGSKSILISASGKNLFTGTQVVIGDKIFTGPADGLILKSNETFDLTTTLDSIATGPGSVVGRYGAAIPLAMQPANGVSPGGVQIVGTPTLDPPLGGYRTLQVHLQSRQSQGSTGNDLTSEQLPKQGLQQGSAPAPFASPIVSINGHIIDPPYTLLDEVTAGSQPRKYVVLKANVATSLVNDGGIVKIFWPFLPTDGWTSVYHFYNPASAFTITRVSDKTIFIADESAEGFDIDPRDDKDKSPGYCWNLLAGDDATKLKTNRCSSGQAGPISASSNGVSVTLTKAIPKKVILVTPYLTTFTLDVPEVSDAKKSDDPTIQIKQFDASWVDVTGKDFTAAKGAEANKIALDIRFPDPPKDAKPGDPAKTIQVHLTRELTVTPGNVDLTISDKDGKRLAIAHLQIACISRCTSGGK